MSNLRFRAVAPLKINLWRSFVGSLSPNSQFKEKSMQNSIDSHEQCADLILSIFEDEKKDLMPGDVETV